MKNISSVEISSGLIPTVNVYTIGNTLISRTDVLQGPRFVELPKFDSLVGLTPVPEFFSKITLKYYLTHTI
jgi:hypothetical protein